MRLRIFEKTTLNEDGSTETIFYAKRMVSLFGLVRWWTMVTDRGDCPTTITDPTHEGLLNKLKALYHIPVIREHESLFVEPK